ncbi:MAG: ABC transporter ATP-binding protein, partial [Patescibacteria group bacterium]
MPTEERAKKIKVKAVIARYYRALLVYPWLLIFAIVGAAGLEASNVIAPLYMRQFINLLAGSEPSQALMVTLFSTLGIFALVNFISWIFQRVRMSAISLLESRVMRDLSNQAFAYMLGHSHDFFISNFAGTLTRRVNRYARAFEQVFDSFILTFFPTALFAIGTIIVLSLQSALLGVGLLVWTAGFFVLQVFMTRWRQVYKVIRSAEDSKVTGILSDTIGNQLTITLFASKGQEQRFFGDAIERWMQANLKSWNADNLIYSIQGIFAIVSEVGLLAAGVYLWSKGALTVGDFVLIQVYVLGLMNRIWDIGHTMRRLSDSMSDASEMVHIFETPHEIIDARAAKPLVVTAGSIDFKDVSFGFNESRSILSNLDLSIAPGEKVALVGPSGAGKSTIT